MKLTLKWRKKVTSIELQDLQMSKFTQCLAERKIIHGLWSSHIESPDSHQITEVKQ